VLRAKGDLDGARGLLEQSEQLYRIMHNQPRAERASHEIGKILLEIGQIKDAHQRLAAAERALDQNGINDYLPGVMLSLGDTLAAEGDLKGAAEQYQRASALCEKMRNAGCTAGSQLAAASVLLDEGELQKAFALADVAAESFKLQKAPANELQARVALAQVLLAENLPREALAEVSKSEALRVPDRILQIYLAITAVRVQAQLGGKQEATERLQHVIEDAKKIGARYAQLQGELAVLKIGNAADPQWSAALDLLHKEATDLGYGLIASKAAR
jgi:tetratricopeptide (TPR) repeat protein